MSTIANITAYDGFTTPALHTLLPISVTREGGKVTAMWRENAASVPTYAQVWCQMSLERQKNGIWREEVRVVVPVMESVSGQNAAGYTAAPKVAYENTISTVGFFHERSDAIGRRLARQLAVNILGNVITSVTPVQTGPAPELLDLLVAPT